MSLEATHPEYSDMLPSWTISRDGYLGEKYIKGKGTKYLPATAGMLLDGMNAGDIGKAEYDAYMLRAVYPSYMADGIGALMGTLHQKPPTFELPPQLESLLIDADGEGTSLQGLLRQINEQQLIAGRIGLLLDLPSEVSTEANFRIVMYNAECIRNWDDKRSFFVLDESGMRVGEDYQWDYVTEYRLLKLLEGVYHFGVDESTLSDSDLTQAVVRGQSLDQLPFVVINTKDVSLTPDNPPLLGLANDAMVIYRSEADYRQSLHMQGQDTLVVTGDVVNSDPNQETALRTGTGAKIHLDQNGDAKYIGVSSSGLPEQREALSADRVRAETKSGALLSRIASGSESGEALKIRLGAQTVTLNQIALTGAAGLERLLKLAAEWVGANPDDVVVTPNTDFTTDRLSGTELKEVTTAKAIGAPISDKSIHGLMVESRLTSFDYEDELEEIAKEVPRAAGNPREEPREAPREAPEEDSQEE